ncbi:hypothetical protein [Lysinibacillus sp. NPDC056185]|uniref:hypothetical protein n=1 Tax=Lysinibacillus sp. NPDC056185 TaxID=3345739 RepID=UPI0039F13157
MGYGTGIVMCLASPPFLKIVLYVILIGRIDGFSVALTSIRHSGASFHHFDLSFRRFGLSFRRSSHSFHRSDFFPSLWRFFPSL